ncbi:MAG TPA: type II toxin-antitoxin system RelE/ParE family toxin [Crinalium sp.]|jgi:mRNA interferase RelE/StbE
MTYTVVIPKTVQKQLDDLPGDVYRRVIEKVQNLAEEPRPPGVVKLKGFDCEYRIRVGDYRVRYEVDDQKLIVILLLCRHRRDVYKR